MLKTLLRRCKQYQIVRKIVTVDPAASDSGIIVNSVVTVYPFHLDYEA